MPKRNKTAVALEAYKTSSPKETSPAMSKYISFIQLYLAKCRNSRYTRSISITCIHLSFIYLPVIIGNESVREGSDCKLSYDRIQNKDGDYVRQGLHNPNKGNATGRLIYKGFYNCDMPVAIVKTQLIRSETQKKENAREF